MDSLGNGFSTELVKNPTLIIHPSLMAIMSSAVWRSNIIQYNPIHDLNTAASFLL